MQVGTTVLYKGSEYKIRSKAEIDFSVLNNVVKTATVYGLSIGIFWEEELEEVESFEDAMTRIAEESAEENFEDFAASTQTTEEPKAVCYTAKEKEEMLWDAENAEHQKAIDEQNELHR